MRRNNGKKCSPRRQWTRWTALGLALLAAAALLWMRTRPTDLLRQAQELWRADPTQAEALLQQSIERSGGDFPDAQLLRCRVLGALGHWPEALGCFSLIGSPAGCDQECLLELATEADAAGQNLLASLALEAADRPGPKQVDCLKALVSLEQATAQHDKLLGHCRQLQSLAPADAWAWRVEVQLHRFRKELRPAIDACRRALRSNIDEPDVRELRGELAGLLMESGELTEARSEMDRLLAIAGAPADLKIKNAYLLRLEGKSQEALAAIEQVFDRAPSTAARMLRGILYFDAGRCQDAADDLERVIAEQPLNKEAHYKLSQAYFKLGDQEAAQRHLQESQRLTRLAIDAFERDRR